MATATDTTTTACTSGYRLFEIEDGIAVSLRLLELAHFAATEVASASPDDSLADAVTQQLCTVMDLLGGLAAVTRQELAA